MKKELKAKIEDFPDLEISPLTKEISEKFSVLIEKSGIKGFSPKIEVWSSSQSNKALAYLSHGIFRYFGKFPSTIARHVIKKYSRKKDLILDPMCGSGTTGLEALLLGRNAICYDINPLSVLISRVKVTSIPLDKSLRHLEDVLNDAKKNKVSNFKIVGLRNPTHWFLPETVQSLSKIKAAIEDAKIPEDLRDTLRVAFLSIVRKASRATTQQGRLFLDAETAIKDALPLFEKKAKESIQLLSEIPSNKGEVIIKEASALDSLPLMKKANVIICHPPYFNAYKYSGVNSLELAWLGMDHSEIRKNEVREAFKVGKIEKLEQYLEDMEKVLRNLHDYLSDRGVLVLMIGDTVIKGTYLPVTKKLIKRVGDLYSIELSALRIPKFTEASWAASQRRKGNQVGINLCDLIVVLKKK